MSAPSPGANKHADPHDVPTPAVPPAHLQAAAPAAANPAPAPSALKEQFLALLNGQESPPARAHAAAAPAGGGASSSSSDEVFLDLVVIAAIIALGYDIRGHFNSWHNVEKFIHLFGAVYNGWRTLVHFFAVARATSGLVDKFGVYAVFTSITGVAIGAFRSASPAVRPFVAVASFASTAIPAVASILRERKKEGAPDEAGDDAVTPRSSAARRLSMSDDNAGKSVGCSESTVQPTAVSAELNQPRQPAAATKGRKWSLSTVMSGGYLASAVPYLVTTFVHNPKVLRALQWVAIVLNLAVSYLSKGAHEFLAGEKAKLSEKFSEKYAVSYETRKYDGLTTLLQAELSLLLLIEGAILLAKDDVRVNYLYAAAAACTAMVYALQMLYNHVDNELAPSATHALNRGDMRAILWTHLHIPYHASNVLFATGLAIAIREIAIPELHGLHFNRHERWLFAGAWGLSMLLSALIGSLHHTNGHTPYRVVRLLSRTAFVAVLTFTMPFTTVSSAWFLLVFLIAMVVWVLAEVVVVHFETIRMERRIVAEATPSSSSVTAAP